MFMKIVLAFNWKGGKVTENKRSNWDSLGLKYLC